jgi:hypothetical protein
MSRQCARIFLPLFLPKSRYFCHFHTVFMFILTVPAQTQKTL